MTTTYRPPRRLCTAALLLAPMLALAADAAQPPQNNPLWQGLRARLFQDRPISEHGDKLIELAAPARAEDAAVVPLSIKSRTVQTAEHYIKTIHLILDGNPAPVAAVFHMTPDSGRADIETRVRVEQYTYVRAVVEMNDGALSMSTAYLKASGGCSAPAGRESSKAPANLGRMKLTVENNPKLNQPAMAQLMIRHPNVSGLAMNQVSRLYEPAHYVRKIEAAYAGKPVMTADLGFAISENPNFRFYFTPGGAGLLTVQAQDTNELTFKAALIVKPQ